MPLELQGYEELSNQAIDMELQKMDIVIFLTLFLSLVKILQKMKYPWLKQECITLFWK